jgi:hypothetical protein
VNSLPDGGQFYGISRIFPGADINRSFSMLSTYRPAHSIGNSRDEAWTKMHEFVEYAISQEDYVVVATGQDNLKYAPPGHSIILGRNEIALQHYHRHLAKVMA